jgi:hypothetical protein
MAATSVVSSMQVARHRHLQTSRAQWFTFFDPWSVALAR